MTEELKTQFISRAKSFGWRIGMMAIAFVITFAIDNLSSFHLTGEVAVIAGLVLGEISKFVNSYIVADNANRG